MRALADLLVGVLDKYFDRGLVVESSKMCDAYLRLATRLRQVKKPSTKVGKALEALLESIPTLFGAADWIGAWSSAWEDGGEIYQQASALQDAATRLAISGRPSGRVASADDYQLASQVMTLLKGYERQKTAKLDELLKRAAATRKPPGPAPTKLSDEQEAVFLQQQFKSRLEVEIPGVRSSRSSNEIKIGEVGLKIGDTPFALLLRLGFELHSGENPSGFVERGDGIRRSGLVKEGYLGENGADQGISRLRKDLGPALEGLAPTEFIEVHAKAVRLSTHPKFISCDWERLRHHPDQLISNLAKRMLKRDQEPE